MIVEPKRECVTRSGEEVHLEPKVMQVLVALAARAEQPVSRDDLLQTVWADVVVGDEVLSRAISMLRTALGDERTDPKFIRTLPRQGYELIVAPAPLKASRLRLWSVVAAISVLTLAAAWWFGRAAEPPVLVLMPVTPATQAIGGAATGISDDLYRLLGQSGGVQTLAKRWSFGLRDSPLPPRGIAEQFGADFILDGDLEPVAAGLRLRLEIVALPDGNSLWWQQFDAANLAALRRAMLEPTRAALNRHVNAEIAALPGAVAQVPERAYLDYLQARHHWSLRGRAHMERAAELLASSIAAVPEFAAARLALAQVYALQPFYTEHPVLPRFALAREQLTLAVAADATLAGAADALEGFMRLRSRDWAGAAASLGAALTADPDNALAHYWMAMLSSALNRQEQALTHARRAAALEPTSPVVLDRLAINELWAGNLGAAGRAFADARRLGYAEGMQSKAYIIYLIRSQSFDQLGAVLTGLGIDRKWIEALLAALEDGAPDDAFIAHTERMIASGALPAELAFGTWVVLKQPQRALASFDLSLKSPDVELLWAAEGQFLHQEAEFSALLSDLSMSEIQ